MIGRGPATANGLHAATYASRSGSRVLIISGDARGVGGRRQRHRARTTRASMPPACWRAAGIRTFVATSPETARGALADAAGRGACRAARRPCCCRSTSSSPRSDVDRAVPPPAPLAALDPRPPQPPRPQAIEAAAALLRQSRKPLIVAGLGAHRAGAKAEIEQLADRIGALLVTSARGKDMFRGHPANLGIVGSFSHSAARRMIDRGRLRAGVRRRAQPADHELRPFAAQGAAGPGRRDRSHIGRWHPADVAVVGDARLAAQALLEALPPGTNAERPFRSEEMLGLLRGFDIARDFEPANTPRTLDPRALGVALEKLLPARRSLVYDAGNFLGIVPYLSVPDPGRFKLTSDFASIGLGFGTALGVAQARPDETTVLVVGDGGFLMTLGELETVVREDLPLVIVVMNDCAYGAELHFLKMRELPVAKSVFPDVDYAPVAEAFGFQAATIRTLADLEKAAPLLARPEGPVLLDCKLNAAVAAPFMSEFHEFETRKH